MPSELKQADALERSICAAVCAGNGLKAREIAKQLGLDHTTVNQTITRSGLLRELCWQDRDYRWHGLVQQTRPHTGLQEFSGWYGTVSLFLSQDEQSWLSALEQGCTNIGRSLTDTRGLIHSFRDCRAQMRTLFRDLRQMLGESCLGWELVFELRLKRSRHVRIYADVLVITENRVFSLEFKMKDAVDPDEVLQAAKYVPYLEILFGKEKDVYPALVLTGASELFTYETIGKTEYILPVCSGDMLFNVFNEAMSCLG
jgi:hypothetical protein